MSLNNRSAREIARSLNGQQVAPETLAQLLEGVADWVWQMDLAGRFVYTNLRVWHILGYMPAEVLGATRFDFMTPEDAREVREVFEHLTGNGEPLQGFEYRMRHKDGRSVILECSAEPMVDASGICQGYRGIDRDITRAKGYEAERERLILKLAQAVAEVQAISGMLPICSCCKKIRDDQGYWQHLEKYISERSQAQFSHGLCPECLERYYGMPTEPR